MLYLLTIIGVDIMTIVASGTRILPLKKLRTQVKDVFSGNSFDGVTESLAELVHRVRPKAFNERLDFGKKVFDKV